MLTLMLMACVTVANNEDAEMKKEDEADAAGDADNGDG